MMYETFLEACIRDGFLRERSRSWKRRFHKYPKGIEVRTEHFEFAEFIKEIEAFLGENISNAIPTYEGEHYRVNRTTRKKSRQLYKYYPNTRYTSRFEQLDKFEWVPDYVKRVCNDRQLILSHEDSHFIFRKKKLNLLRFKTKRLIIFPILNARHKKNKRHYEKSKRNKKVVCIFHLRKQCKLNKIHNLIIMGGLK